MSSLLISVIDTLQICEELMTRCLAPDCQMGGLGCDNMTVVLVCLLNGGSYDELAEKCARPALPPNYEELGMDLK